MLSAARVGEAPIQTHSIKIINNYQKLLPVPWTPDITTRSDKVWGKEDMSSTSNLIRILSQEKFSGAGNNSAIKSYYYGALELEYNHTPFLASYLAPPSCRWRCARLILVHNLYLIWHFYHRRRIPVFCYKFQLLWGYLILCREIKSTMTGLVKAKKYDWNDSNLALFGSDTEKQVLFAINSVLFLTPNIVCRWRSPQLRQSLLGKVLGRLWEYRYGELSSLR